MVPWIDIRPLFGPANAARKAVDRAIMEAAGDIGSMSVHGLPETAPLSEAQRRALPARGVAASR